MTEGYPFPGLRRLPDIADLKRRKVVHFRRKLRTEMRAYRAGELPAEKVAASVLGWINHVRYGDTWGLRRAVLREVVLYGN